MGRVSKDTNRDCFCFPGRVDGPPGLDSILLWYQNLPRVSMDLQNMDWPILDPFLSPSSYLVPPQQKLQFSSHTLLGATCLVNP